MTIEYFIQVNNIQPADAIVVQKQKFGILDHYVIYLGKGGDGEHKFIANYTAGIRFLPYQKLLEFLMTYIPVRINKFIGDRMQRTFAVQRALSRLNENAYNLILNNCEHFKNFVHFGIEKSEQVEEFGGALAVGGLGIAAVGLATDNEGLAYAGLFTSILGLITLVASDNG